MERSVFLGCWSLKRSSNHSHCWGDQQQWCPSNGGSSSLLLEQDRAIVPFSPSNENGAKNTKTKTWPSNGHWLLVAGVFQAPATTPIAEAILGNDAPAMGATLACSWSKLEQSRHSRLMARMARKPMAMFGHHKWSQNSWAQKLKNTQTPTPIVNFWKHTQKCNSNESNKKYLQQ